MWTYIYFYFFLPRRTIIFHIQVPTQLKQRYVFSLQLCFCPTTFAHEQNTKKSTARGFAFFVIVKTNLKVVNLLVWRGGRRPAHPRVDRQTDRRAGWAPRPTDPWLSQWHPTPTPPVSATRRKARFHWTLKHTELDLWLSFTLAFPSRWRFENHEAPSVSRYWLHNTL